MSVEVAKRAGNLRSASGRKSADRRDRVETDHAFDELPEPDVSSVVTLVA